MLAAASTGLPRWVAAAAPIHEAPSHFVLLGGSVHRGDGSTIESGALEVQNGTIVRVDTSDDAMSPEAVRIDASGKIVTPGFVAAASSIGAVEIDMEASTADLSSAADAEIRAAYDVSRAIYADSTLLAAQALEGITSAITTPTGGLISGRAAWIDLLEGEHRTIVGVPRVAMHVDLRGTVGGSRVATLARLDEVLDDAAEYRSRRAAFERRQLRELAAHRLHLESLWPVLDGTMPLLVHADRASEILAAIDLARVRSLRVVVVGGSQAVAVAPELASASIPVLLQPTSNVPHGFEDLGTRLDRAAILHAAGVEIGIARPGDAHNVRNLRQEAGIAIAHGLPRDVALRGLTLSIARAYGQEARYGTIAPGKIANLVSWSGDPFDFSSHAEQVWIRGQATSMRSRQTELRDRYLPAIRRSQREIERRSAQSQG